MYTQKRNSIIRNNFLLFIIDQLQCDLVCVWIGGKHFQTRVQNFQMGFNQK